MTQATVRAFQSEDAKTVNDLLSQLTGKSIEIDSGKLLGDQKVFARVVIFGEKVIGFGSLVLYQVPSAGEVGRIEDVVIDQDYQRQGYGEMLMLELLKIAKERNIKWINLTSSKFRIAAHRLYEKLGFIRRESDVYALNLD